MKALFTLGNPKTVKGEAQGVLTAVLHLSPAKRSGVANVCSHASPVCIKLCLNIAGRGGIFKAGERTNTIQEARKRRTRDLFRDPLAFVIAADAELVRLRKLAARRGLRLAVRVNGTSDLPWLAHTLASRNPDLTFYDYTKIPHAWSGAPENLTYTFSRSECNAAHVDIALAAGINVAVVFSTKRGQPLPASYMGRPVVDGDLTDYRPSDPRGVIVGLRAKGKARGDTAGFVVDVDRMEDRAAA